MRIYRFNLMTTEPVLASGDHDQKELGVTNQNLSEKAEPNLGVAAEQFWQREAGIKRREQQIEPASASPI